MTPNESAFPTASSDRDVPRHGDSTNAQASTPSDIMETAHSPSRRNHGAEECSTRISIEVVVVDGDDGRRLAQRQAAVIRQVLAWHTDHAGRRTTTGHPVQEDA